MRYIPGNLIGCFFYTIQTAVGVSFWRKRSRIVLESTLGPCAKNYSYAEGWHIYHDPYGSDNGKE